MQLSRVAPTFSSDIVLLHEALPQTGKNRVIQEQLSLQASLAPLLQVIVFRHRHSLSCERGKSKRVLLVTRVFRQLTHQAPQHEQGNVSYYGSVVTEGERMVKVQDGREMGEQTAPPLHHPRSGS
jgi:hypothetical protein